jgi:ubiquitin C-terminal hydrolase
VNESHKILRSEANPEDTTILVLAPTGSSSFQIGGHTIHSALKIPRLLSAQYVPLAEDALNTLCAQLGSLEILIIDEISMVDRRLMTYIEGRLRQIKRVRSTSTYPWFGNVSVLAVGDFYQLPPVKSKSIVIQNDSLGIDIWHDFFTITYLDEIMRQKDDVPFAQLLNRLRLKTRHEPISPEDNDILQSRNAVQNEPEHALHVFATNSKANAYNQQMLDKMSSNPRKLVAKDYERNAQSGKITSTCKKGKPDDLPDVLTIDTGARVMLVRNIDVSDGLVNGAFGQVVGFQQDNSCSETSGIFVSFDSEKVGRKRCMSSSAPDKSILITLHEEPMASQGNVTRRQYPLKLAWGCTIHKVQGITTDQCVFDMKGVFQSGQSYVALSRVTSLAGLYLQNYDPDKIYRNDDIHSSLQKMPQHPGITETKSFDPIFTALHQNIQGLKSKVMDIKNRCGAICDVMLFSETLLRATVPYSSLHIDGYAMLHKERPGDTGRGGLAIYIADTIPFTEIEYSSHDIEHMIVLVHDASLGPLLILLLYRPPSYKVTHFNQKMLQLLSYIDSSFHDTATIIAGDLNENLLDEKPHPIYQLLRQFHYEQQVKSYTTTNGTLLDVFYTKACRYVKCDVLPTYYSDHEAIKLSFFSETTFNSINTQPVLTDTQGTPDSCNTHNEERTHTYSKTTKKSKKIPKKVPSTNKEKRPVINMSVSGESTKSKSHSNATPGMRPQLNSQTSNTRITTQTSEMGHCIKGIFNLGNTCYANSLLQVLFHIPQLQPLLHTQLPLSNCLLQLKTEAQNPNSGILFPIELFEMAIMFDWQVYEQQDVHDFFMHVTRCLHNEEVMSTQNEMTTVKRTIYGQMTHQFTCSDCAYSNTESETFNSIFYPIQVHSINHITIEPSGQPSTRNCNQCQRQSLLCNTDITQTPPVLLIQLGMYDDYQNKLQARIALEQQLVTKGNITYSLSAVIQHHGRTINSGHYTVLLKHSGTEEWYKCDDANVQLCNLPVYSTDAYILLYSKSL